MAGEALRSADGDLSGGSGVVRGGSLAHVVSTAWSWLNMNDNMGYCARKCCWVSRLRRDRNAATVWMALRGTIASIPGAARLSGCLVRVRSAFRVTQTLDHGPLDACGAFGDVRIHRVLGLMCLCVSGLGLSSTDPVLDPEAVLCAVSACRRSDHNVRSRWLGDWACGFGQP